MGRRPTIRQIKLFRSIGRKLGVPPEMCLRLQDELNREEMAEWIRKHQPKATLLGLSDASLYAGICKMRRETLKFQRSLIFEAAQKGIPEEREEEDNDASDTADHGKSARG